MGAYIINVPSTVDRIIYTNVDPMNGKTYIASYSVDDLTPYTGPDFEQIMKEAYKDGYNAGFGKKIHTSYQEGLSDAWETARRIGSDSRYGLEKMGFKFEPRAVGDDPGWYVVQRYSASECIKRIRLVTILEKMRGEQDG